MPINFSGRASACFSQNRTEQLKQAKTVLVHAKHIYFLIFFYCRFNFAFLAVNLDQDWKMGEKKAIYSFTLKPKRFKVKTNDFKLFFDFFYYIFSIVSIPKCRNSRNEIHIYDKNIHMLVSDTIQTIEKA